jgi:hypothetical protein
MALPAILRLPGRPGAPSQLVGMPTLPLCRLGLQPGLPNEAVRSEVDGINDAGAIVGYFLDSGGSAYGYLVNRLFGTYSQIDYPGATDTFVHDINNLGDIVGTYFDADGVQHGFFAAPVPVPMTVLLFGSGLAGLAS